MGKQLKVSDKYKFIFKAFKAGCIKVNHCKCILADGSGVISLAALGDSQGYLERLTLIPSGDGHDAEALLSFNPCVPFSEPDDFPSTDCIHVAACMTVRYRTFRYISRHINYGRHEDNVFKYNSNIKTLTVSYPGPSSSRTQARVHFQCSPNLSVSVSHSLGGDVPLEMWVDHPCVCPNACTLEDVGPGTIFLSATAYFVLGSCAPRPFRTRSGVHIAPEDRVWCSLCYLFAESRERPNRTDFEMKVKIIVQHKNIRILHCISYYYCCYLLT
uniref:Uncharacterized protein n=1 Tax=Scleropages formosus TaxID=113540 RepID=A0A8C9RIC2_SCLFO